MVAPTLLYMVYAVCFVVFLGMMGRQTSSDMYAAAMHRFEASPFRQNPPRNLHDVRGSRQVYEWITNAFIPQLYRFAPTQFDSQNYCTESYQCTLGEGRTDSDAHCAGSLVAGRNNCPSYLGRGGSCCEPCTGPLCPNITVTTVEGDFLSTSQAPNLSGSCADTMPSWLQDLSQWTRPDARRLQAKQPNQVPFVFCPERMSPVPSSANVRTASEKHPFMLGNYNRVMMGRASLKRVKIIPHESKAFLNAYPMRMSSTRISAYSYSSNENTAAFGDPSKRSYSYGDGVGFNGAGGFIQFVDFDQQERVKEQFAILDRDYWFDLNQGSFALELMLFNGNVNKFLYVSFAFEHDFSGTTKVTVTAAPLELSLHDLSMPEAWLRFLLYITIVVLFCYFVKSEVEEFSADWTNYLSDFMTVVHVTSLAMTAYCIILYMSITLSYTYLHYEFREFEVKLTKHQEFEDLANLAINMEHFMATLSVTTFLICIRCISVMTTLIPQTGLVVNSVLHVKYNLTAFCTAFSVLMIAATITSYFFFGARVEAFSTITYSIITTIQMVMKDPICHVLQRGDEQMGYGYFIIFHLFFLIVQQSLLSILIGGYFTERSRIDKLRDADRYPMHRLSRKTSEFIRNNCTIITRCFLNLQQLIFGSPVGGSARVNHEQVAMLRDKRVTQPRMRTLVYEQKQEEETEQFDLLADLKFRTVPPFFPGGMMQFYVDFVTPGGPASDVAVQVGFRLLEIKTAAGPDRLKFRLYDEATDSVKHDPQKVLRDLKKLPLTLVFEGRAKPLTWECGFQMGFMTVFLVWALVVVRCTDSFQQHMVHEHALVSPQWYVSSPMRIKSFDNIASMGDVAKWVQVAVVDTEYGCSAEINGVACSTTGFGLNAKGGRKSWFLWRGLGEQGDLTKIMEEAAKVPPLYTMPLAAQGLSVGFVPLTPPVSLAGEGRYCGTEGLGNPDRCYCDGAVKFGYGVNWTAWKPTTLFALCSSKNFGDPLPGQTKICMCREDAAITERTVRLQNYNLGVMPHNHVRMTFQTPCFVDNKEDRWKYGVRWILDSVMSSDVTCADSACMQEEMEKRQVCLNDQGEVKGDNGKVRGEWSGINYTYSKVGSYAELGGFTVGFGNTQAEATVMSSILDRDQIFKRKAVSAVFELVTYNANFDLFAYVTIKFSVQSTGKLVKDMTSTVFPLRLFSMGSKGGSHAETILCWILFVLYMLCAVVFTIRVFRDLYIQSCISKALLSPSYQFLMDFFTEEWWSVVDILILILNIMIIETLFEFMLIESVASVRNGIKSWSGSYAFALKSDLNTVDRYREFARAASLYNRFNIVVSLNGLFLIIRSLKYFSGVMALRMILTAISRAIQELILVTTISFIVLGGFVLIFFIHFGVKFPLFGNSSDAFVNLFMFVLGRFGIDSLIRESPLFCLCFFPIFYMLFFLLLNMLLAAIVFSWKDVRRDAQEFSFSSALSTLRDSAPWHAQRTKDEKEDMNLTKLNVDFWQKLSILRFVNTLDELGKITVAKRSQPQLKGTEITEDGEDDRDEAEIENEEDIGFNFDSTEDQKKFLKVFRKAHMELASRMCRMGEPSKRDNGGGVGLDEHGGRQPKEEAALAKTDGHNGTIIGIVEDEQPDEQVEQIIAMLGRKLGETDHISSEIWLDALLTVLENRADTNSVSAIEKLQAFFLPMPMITPKKPQEWNAFKEKKVKLELRLDSFVKWLQEIARLQHLAYLKEMTESKERVLKQQSLVLTDYLETLDEQIKKIEEELQELEREKSRLSASRD